jgi:hypothetical protein
MLMLTCSNTHSAWQQVIQNEGWYLWQPVCQIACGVAQLQPVTWRRHADIDLRQHTQRMACRQ